MATHLPQQRAPQKTEIPDKLYFRIGEVARLCSVAPYVLRFWESEFTQLKPNKSGTGQRLYRRRDVEMALRVKRLLYDEGYTIAGARQAIQAETRSKRGAASRNSPCRNNNKLCSGQKRGCTKCARNCERFWDCFPAPSRKRKFRSKSGPSPPRRLNPGSSSCRATGSSLFRPS